VTQQTLLLQEEQPALTCPAPVHCKLNSLTACALLACALQTAKQAALASVHERREAVRATLQLAPAPPGVRRRPCGAMLLPSTGASLPADCNDDRAACLLHVFRTPKQVVCRWRKAVGSHSSRLVLAHTCLLYLCHAQPGPQARKCTNLSEFVGASEDARWVDAAWLGQWADGAEAPPPIDNAPLLCEHGKLDPGKAAGGSSFSFLISCVDMHLCRRGMLPNLNDVSLTARCVCPQLVVRSCCQQPASGAASWCVRTR
jgi:hypothetical protein